MRGASSTWKRAALFLYVPTMLMSLGQGMIVPALPVLGTTFGVAGEVAVQAITAQLVGRAVSLIPAGAIVDRWGTKLIMVGGSGLAAAAAFAAALAPNFVVVLVAQFFWGAGMSAWMFGREFAAFDMVRPEQRGRQMSALMGIGSTGMTLGPALGGALTDAVGVRGLFYAYAFVSCLVLALSLSQRSVTPQRAEGKRSLFSFKSVKEITPYFRATYLILFFSTFAQMARLQVTNSMLPLHAQDTLGYSATATGLLFTVMGGVTFAMILPTGFISDKIGRKWAAAPAAVCTAIGFVVFPFAKDYWSLAVVAAILGIAGGLSMGAMTIYTYDIVPAHVRGQLQAMRRSFGEVGGVMSPPIAAAAAALYAPAMAFWAFAPIHIVSAFLLVFVAKESLQKRRPAGVAGDEPPSRVPSRSP